MQMTFKLHFKPVWSCIFLRSSHTSSESNNKISIAFDFCIWLMLRRKQKKSQNSKFNFTEVKIRTENILEYIVESHFADGFNQLAWFAVSHPFSAMIMTFGSPMSIYGFNIILIQLGNDDSKLAIRNWRIKMSRIEEQCFQAHCNDG